jgi:hypothetical protein
MQIVTHYIIFTFFFKQHAANTSKNSCFQATTGIQSIATMANLTVQQTRLRYIFFFAIDIIFKSTNIIGYFNVISDYSAEYDQVPCGRVLGVSKHNIISIFYLRKKIYWFALQGHEEKIK